MNKKYMGNALLLAGVISVIPLLSLERKSTMQQQTTTLTTESLRSNPLLNAWMGPFGGVPPFDQVSVPHFKPALEAAMKEKLEQVEAIANNPAPATFENTMAALERTGYTLDQVEAVYSIWSNNLSTAEFQEVETEMEPKMAALRDKIIQNEKLFRRIEAVYLADKSKLTPEQQRLAWSKYTNFVRAGAKLNSASKTRLAAINQELASLFTKFSQNILADETDFYVVIDDEADLSGLSLTLKDAARTAAEERHLPGKWIITNTRSSVDPFLTYADNRALREKVWKMFVNRGDNGNEHDNNKIITRILQLRLERANLLGYETHAHWALENTMAKTPSQALDLLEKVWAPATQRVRQEVLDMQNFAKNEGSPITIEPWDYRYYMEKVRKQRYDLDQNEIKPYLQLDKLRDGMFFVAEELFNLRFVQVTNVPVYHPDVTVYEVKETTSNRHVGLFYFDPYARKGKRSGAWMNAYREQENMDRKITTIVSNNSNFVKGKPGEPVLISWDDATTLFHEFGHGLHGLCSNVTYRSLSGTSVVRDYVEFPSQLLEHWLGTEEVLKRYATHFQQGSPMPRELVEKIRRAATFNQGFATTEYLSSALIDLKLHLSKDNAIDPDKFEKVTLGSLGMPRELVMRHRTPQFLHIFSSDGYAAGYYSYIWADVLTADGYNAFTEANGPYDKAVAQRLLKYVFSVGNTIDPSEGYRSFRKGEPGIEALMEKRGFKDNL